MASDRKIFVRQIKSGINQLGSKKKTLTALGLGRIGKTNTISDSPQVRGMVRAVLHLVEVRDV